VSTSEAAAAVAGACVATLGARMGPDRDASAAGILSSKTGAGFKTGEPHICMYIYIYGLVKLVMN
jgi:hypothetical protein